MCCKIVEAVASGGQDMRILLTTMAHTAGWPMIRLQGVTSRAFCILLYDAEATGRPPAELQHHHDKMSASCTCVSAV